MRASAASTRAAAAASPGVVAVLTGADMAADKVGPMAPLWAIRSSDGKPMAEPPRWALARGTVRHVGEPVAAVIAETLRAGAGCRRAACEVDYEPLPAVIDGRAALAKDAPQLHDAAPGNVCFRFARGDEAAVRKAFAGAAHVVAARSRQQPADRRRDRAARRARRRQRRRQAHALLLDAGAASHPPHRRRAARAAADRDPADRARCRRRLRLQGQALSRGDHRRLGGAAAAAGR